MAQFEKNCTITVLPAESDIYSMELTLAGTGIRLNSLLSLLGKGSWIQRHNKRFLVRGKPAEIGTYVLHKDTVAITPKKRRTHEGARISSVTVRLPTGSIIKSARITFWGTHMNAKLLLKQLDITARNKDVYIDQEKIASRTRVTDGTILVVRDPRPQLNPDGILWPEGNGRLLSGKKPNTKR